MNPIHALRSYLLKIHENAMYVSTSKFSKWSLLSGVPTKLLHVFLSFCMHATYLAFLNLLLLMTLVMVLIHEECPSLCSFHHPPVTSSFSGPNIQLSTPFSGIPNLCSSLNARTQTSCPRKQQIKIQFYVASFNYHVFHRSWEGTRF
jgi:hypothetical protein